MQQPTDDYSTIRMPSKYMKRLSPGYITASWPLSSNTKLTLYGDKL